MFDPAILVPALGDAVRKLDPRVMVRNPVMFVVEVVAALTTLIFVRDLVAGRPGLGFTVQILLWLWFTVLFANLAEAVAEGRGKAQAATLRKRAHRDHRQERAARRGHRDDPRLRAARGRRRAGARPAT